MYMYWPVVVVSGLLPIALLQTTFGVRFIISFASLFYMAFIKNVTVGCFGKFSAAISNQTGNNQHCDIDTTIGNEY